MTTESAQDRLDMLEALGEEVIFTHYGDTHPSSKSVSVFGIFDKPYIETARAEGYAPVMTMRDTDIDGVSQGAMIRRNPDGTYTDYKVVEVQPDGTGITNLILQEQ